MVLKILGVPARSGRINALPSKLVTLDSCWAESRHKLSVVNRCDKIVIFGCARGGLQTAGTWAADW